MGKTVAVLGAGNAGTTFALLATHNANAVRLWTIEEDLAKQMQRMRENAKYLPGIKLPETISIEIDLQEVDPEKLRKRGIDNAGNCRHVRVAYLTGPLFFAATSNFNEAFARLENTRALILSMRGVPLIDTSGLQAMGTLLH